MLARLLGRLPVCGVKQGRSQPGNIHPGREFPTIYPQTFCLQHPYTVTVLIPCGIVADTDHDSIRDIDVGQRVGHPAHNKLNFISSGINQDGNPPPVGTEAQAIGNLFANMGGVR